MHQLGFCVGVCVCGACACVHARIHMRASRVSHFISYFILRRPCMADRMLKSKNQLAFCELKKNNLKRR